MSGSAEGNGLTDVIWMDVCCDNCGRGKRISGRQVAEFSRRGHRTVEQIGGKLVCSYCAEQGKQKRNVKIVPHFRERPVRSAKQERE